MTSKITYVLIALILILIFGNYLLYQKTQLLEKEVTDYKKQNDYYLEKLSQITVNQQSVTSTPSVVNHTSQKTVMPVETNKTSLQSITAVAVRPVLESDGFFETTNYQGTVMKITVEIRDGNGQVLVNTVIPTGVDFQTSARTAVEVAQKITGADLSKKDVIFSISSENDQELQAVDGGSAGGAMTVLLTSEILNKPIHEKILMTGTIEHDDTIGKIGAVAQKADAAGKYGAKIFLVPQGQAIVQVQSCTENQQGPLLYRSCTLENKPLSPITEKEYGMKVIEVANIEQALTYFNS